MMISVEQFLTIAGALTALGVILKTAWSLHTFIKDGEKVFKDVESIKKEQKLMVNALNACLDGLSQLGCNHTVTETREKLNKYINEHAHE